MMGDALVVGGGPAGAMAARTLAEKGCDVIVFEKGPLRREKPCGGGVPEVALKEFSIDFKGGRSVYGLFLCSPQNKTVNLIQKERAGIAVMRSDFDYFLMQKAREKGAEIKENSYAEPLLKNGVLKGVETREESYESDIVIVCDGAQSRFSRKMGIYSGSKENQALAFQYQMALDNEVIEDQIGSLLELYFGAQWVPRGYTWIFPKEGMVTVGNATWLTTMRSQKVDLKSMLDHFIERHPVASPKLKDATILYPQSGILSFTGIVQSIYGNHFLVAGDAGGFISQATGGGVYYAMVSGKTAGEVAAEAVERGDFSRKFLKEYKKRVDEKIGADMKWGPFMRNLILNKEKDQEWFLRAIREDPWIRELSVLLLKEEIRYDAFLMKLFMHPHKILKFIVG